MIGIGGELIFKMNTEYFNSPADGLAQDHS
jgi:hypothetical protein